MTDLQPYLGAFGHLVALRDGDLAYLHVHPVDSDEAAIRFVAEYPSAGTYRLFLDFAHDGVVRTASFTVEPRAIRSMPRRWGWSATTIASFTRIS